MDAQLVSTGMSSQGFKWTGGDTVDRQTGGLLEVVLGPPNFKSIWWLERAVETARHVARVKLPNGSATGFLISNNIFLTNNHVFENENDARRAKLQFDYRLLANGDLADVDVWECDPDVLFHTNAALDYTIVKVKPKDEQDAGDVWGFFDPRHGVTISEGNRVNIIQHPQGRFKEIAFRDNQVKSVAESYVQYITDTDYGSSGSPVLDDSFRVVALHNQRVPDPNAPSRWYRNQGYRIEAILEDAGPRIPENL